LGGDDERAPLGAGCGMVTADQVWAALDELPDPEIPVISLVELGVVGDVSVDGPRVSVTLTPTFLGCPALDAMRRALEAKLRAAGFAPPAPREASAPRLVQLQSKAFRCPYCGSSETRLENLFGPTPCR